MAPVLGAEADGVNPARAGMILKSTASVAVSWGKPRTRGDDPTVVLSAAAAGS